MNAEPGCAGCAFLMEMLLPQAPEPAVCLPLVHQPTIPCARAPGLDSARIASTHCEVPLFASPEQSQPRSAVQCGPLSRTGHGQKIKKA